MDERKKQEQLEGVLTFARITELAASPVQGSFDVAHLKEVHRRIFQDFPHYAPGQFRPDAVSHLKARELESGARYHVHYASRKAIDEGLAKVLNDFGGPQHLRDLNPEQFADRIARLYGDLDYLHPFKEGNSRTLRSFTRQLAQEAGYELHWNTSNANGHTRDRLYMARDREVLERAFPGLDEAKAMKTESRDEYEAYLTLQGLKRSAPLKDIVLEGMRSQAHVRDARYFLDEHDPATLRDHPRLAGAYGLMAAIEKQTEQAGLDGAARDAVLAKARHNIADQIAKGTYPDVRIKEAIEIKREPSRER